MPAEKLPQQQPITETLEKNFMPYAMSVIVSRAIPEIDGFKPSHRKLLYTMFRMGLLGGTRTKSANVVGQTMKLNPHGDQAIYETLVRLTRGNSALLHPYIDSKGNFGRQYSRDMQYAAARYTEVRLDRICEEIFRGIDKNCVDFIDNYDNTQKEPLLLPASFPSILVNSNQGIAVGMASNICSFNLTEVCRAATAYIRDPGADLLSIMPAPDFSTGAELIYNAQEMEQIYRTGRGSIRLRSTWRYDKKNSLIEI
ncbi:MAG: DNA gyrase subunit A, partial [Bacillota bacterium]|nr:DNA gyrase subunit A [Bacillota bacterium]